MLNANDVKIKKLSEQGDSAVFSFEPLPKGFGYTLGNTLRRILLTSMPGGAVTQMKIEGAVHQFSTVPGIKEDLVEIGLNLKQLRASVEGSNPVVGTIDVKGPGKVTAGDIEVSSEVKIINKDLHIATLADNKAKFTAEFVFENGVGYSPVEERETSKVGVILLDALFSPVVSANYEVEETRKGTQADLDKLVMTIETDGSLDPSEALSRSASLLRDFFKRFAMAEDPEEVETEVESVGSGSATDSRKVLIEELPLPTRTINALKKAGIDTLADLMSKSKEDLADVKNLGEKSVEEINKLVEKERSAE